MTQNFIEIRSTKFVASERYRLLVDFAADRNASSWRFLKIIVTDTPMRVPTTKTNSSRSEYGQPNPLVGFASCANAF